MVGVPRSKGCSSCIRRRVKHQCDEKRPSCSRCDRYDEKCPGYSKGAKFVQWTLHKQQPGNSATPNGEPQYLTHGSTLVPKAGSIASRRTLGSSINSLSAGPDLIQMQFLSILIADVSRGHTPAPDAALVGRWLSCIPERLGKSNALDQAVRCMAANHMGNVNGNAAMIIHGRAAYGRALSSLQKASRDPVKVYSSETLCAAMLLCMYELFASTTSDSWMKHADGVGRLLQLRGPGWHWSEFDKAMLVAVKGLLIMEALFSLKYCFLDNPEWDRVITQPSGQPISPFYDVAQDFTRYLAKCPGLVKEAYLMASATATQRSNLIERTLEIYSSFRDWFEHFSTIVSPPNAIKSSMNDSIYSMVHEYSDPATATLYCGYYACIIVIHEVLKKSHYEVEYSEENRILADNICKSVEYLAGTGTMGPYRIGFSLRVAFEVADMRTKLWIRGWLEQFQRFYGAMNVQSFPAIEEDDAVGR